jgi:hypothetical protein
MKSESKTEEDNQRPKRISTIFGNEIRERKQARPPQKAGKIGQRIRLVQTM